MLRNLIKLVPVVCLIFLGQICKSQCTLAADFSVLGFTDNASSVQLNLSTQNSPQNYYFKSLATCLCCCNGDTYRWYITPVSTASPYSSSSITFNDQPYNTSSNYIGTPPTKISFSVPGTYSVKLELTSMPTAFPNDCSPSTQIKLKENYIVVPYPTPLSNFKTNGTEPSSVSVAINNTVNFTDASTQFPTSWQWTITPSTGWAFASGSSTSKSPVIKFTSLGQYTVALKVTNPGGTNTLTKNNHINVINIAPVANFKINNSTETPIKVVQQGSASFTDNSINSPTSWLWTVSPASGWSYTSGSSTTSGPNIKFTTLGDYSVSLKATNSGGTNTISKTNCIMVIPPAPLVSTTNLSYCQGNTSVPLSASGSNLKWYTTATGSGYSTSITPSTNSVGTQTYYVSQTVNGYESPRSSINVVIYGLPASPVVRSNILYCTNAPTSALTATGTNLKWYTVSNLGTGTSSAPVPSSTSIGSTSYYVSQTNNNGCEGPRSEINVNIVSALQAPVVTSPINYCLNAPVTSSLSATGVGLTWYTTPSGGSGLTTAPTPSTLITGNVAYYVAQNSTGCLESPRSAIVVSVSDVSTPSSPIVISPVGYLQGDTASALTATGSGLQWYSSPIGGVASSVTPTPSTTSPGIQTYYVTQTQNNCESPRKPISVQINALTPPPGWSFAQPLIRDEPLSSGSFTERDKQNYMVKDKIGNIYSAGQLFDFCRFPNGASFDPDSSASPMSDCGFYIEKLDKNLNLKWAKGIGTTMGSSLFLIVSGIAVDSVGNSYVSGRFWGTLKFNSSVILTNTAYEVFMAKYDSMGQFVWVKSIKSTGSNLLSGGIKIDKEEKIILSGQFTANATISGTTLSYAGSNNFLAKYEQNGNLIWAKQDTTPSVLVKIVCMDIDNNNNIYVSGVGGIKKYNTSGKLLFTKTGTASTVYSDAVGMDVDQLNRICIVNKYGTIVYDSAGMVLWSNAQSGSGVVVDTSGNTYVSGVYTGTIKLGRYLLSCGNLSSSTRRYDNYVAKYSVSGKVIWAQNSIDSTVVYGNSELDFRNHIIINDNNNCLVSYQGYGRMSPSGPRYTGSRCIGVIGDANPDVTGFFPLAAKPGESINIKGYRLGNASGVSFGSITAPNFQVQSSEELIAIVPPGASTDYIYVKNASGVDSSNTALIVYDQNPESAPEWEWVNNLVGLGMSKRVSLRTDANGNIYMVGNYGNSQLQLGDSISNPCRSGSYIIKYNSGGKLIWAKRFFDNINSTQGGGEMQGFQVDKQGNSYIAGSMYRNGIVPNYLNFCGSNYAYFNVSTSPYSQYYTDNYLIKIDSTGEYQWAIQITQGQGDEVVNDIAVDSMGNCYVSGTYQNATSGTFASNYVSVGVVGGSSPQTVNFSYDMTSTGRPKRGFLLKYDRFGNVKFCKDLLTILPGSVYPIRNNKIIVNAGSYLYYYDSTGQTIGFDPQVSLFYYSQSEWGDDNTYVSGSNLSFDAKENRYLYGTYGLPSDSTFPYMRKFGKTDICLVKYNPANQVIWSKVFGGAGIDLADAMVLDPSGNAYVTGTFQDSIQIGGIKLLGNGMEDIFMAKFNPNGKLLWVQNATGMGLSKTFQYVYSNPYRVYYVRSNQSNLSINQSGNLLYGISTPAQVTFGNKQIPVASSNLQLVLAKLGSSPNTSLSGTATICSGCGTSLLSSLTGNFYQWQLDTGNGFFDLSDNEIYSGVNTNQLIINRTDTTWQHYQYRCIVDGNQSQLIQLQSVTSWVGSINNSWENGLNWSCTGRLPDGTSDVQIPSGNVIINSNVNVNSINIGPSATLTITPGHTLEVNQ